MADPIPAAADRDAAQKAAVEALAAAVAQRKPEPKPEQKPTAQPQPRPELTAETRSIPGASAAPDAGLRGLLRQAAAASGRHGLAAAGIAGAALLAWGVFTHQSAQSVRESTDAIADLRQAGESAQRRQQQALEKLAAQLDKVAIRVETLAQRPRGGDDNAKTMKAGVERIETGLDKVKQDVAARIAPLADQLSQADKGQKDLSLKLAQVMERLDRLEKAEKASITGALPPPRPEAKVEPAKVEAAKIEPAKAEPAKAEPAVKGWSVRSVENGVALLENRGELFEVTRGVTVPGLGKIQSFERKDGGWTVLTSQGRIAGRT